MGGYKVAKGKHSSLEGRQRAMEAESKQAENNVAGSTNANRNQKGHVPNSPSTG